MARCGAYGAANEIRQLLRKLHLQAAMNIVRIYTGADGESHFEDSEVKLNQENIAGMLSELQPATGIVFRETGPDYDYDWHNAPRRQYVITLRGEFEVEIGDGSVRRLGPGSILLAEDVTGHGHKSRAVGDEIRESIFVTLD